MTTQLLTTPTLRRWALALSGLLGTSLAAQAQSLNYAAAGSANVAGTFTSIASAGTAIATTSTDDANSAAQPIGFTFNFNGTAFTQFVLNTNGFIKLGATVPSSASLFFTPENTIAGDVFSSTSASDVNIIAPFNCDLESSGTTTATYQVQTSGTAPNRICTIQWTGVRDKALTNSPQYTNFSFQVKLYETSNRVELVYGLPTAGTGTDAFRYSGAGIKGSGASSGQMLVFTKASTQTWDAATVLNAPYSGNTLNYRQTVPPDAGRTFRFNQTLANDAAVSTIYTYGKLATPAALPHAVQAVITNVGTTAQTNLVATLNVTGANTFTDTKTIASLAAGASATVTFASYPATLTAGTNTVTVTLPSDDNATNNSAVYGQQVTSSRVTYLDPSGTLNTTGVGVGQAGGVLVSKYTLSAAAYLSDVALTFAASAGNATNYQVLVYDATGTGGVPGNLLYTSATQTRTAAAGTTTITLPGTAVPTSFYIGVKELDTNPALAYQVEDPLRPNTYYYSLNGTSGWTSVNNTTLRTRLAIEFGLGAAPACAPPTLLTAGSITPTTASLTFTPASGAANYTLTYTPTGGTAQTQTVTASPVALTGLTPNTTYTVSLVTNCSGSTTSAAATTTFTTPVAPPANDDCVGAIALTPGATCTPTSGTTVGATQSLAPITCNGFSSSTANDVWYSFVAASTGEVITVAGGTGFDAVVDVRSGACANTTNIGCADATASGGTETVTLTGLTVGTTYFVRVYGYSSTGTFTICVTNLAACSVPTSLAASSITATSANLSFTPGNGNTSYTITYTPAGGTATTVTPAPTASPVALTGLTPNTVYTVTVTGNCSGSTTSATATTTFTTLAPAPANDNPTGAIALAVSATCTPTNGTNAGATTTTASGYTNPGTCGIAINPKDVWYTFTTLAGQTAATVTVTGNPAGLVRVFSAASSAGPFTQVSCSAGSTNNTVAPALALTGLTPATTYYISVSGYGSGDTQGAFTICVTGTGTAPCPAPTALTATNVTATGATLTFTAATGATNYTLTYTPAGGTAQTQTVTASPVALTGLQAGKQYTVSLVTNCSASSTSTAATATFTTLAPAPTNPAAGSITATGASISFTPAAGATSYTVTYTRAGGTAVTVTVTGSPVVLTGLTANSTYTVTIVANYPGGGASSPATLTFTTAQNLAVRATLSGGELVVYPNPAHRTFTVSLPALGAARAAQLELVNALGQVVSRQAISLTAGGTRVPVDAVGLPTGVYSVQVRVNGETAVTRLVLE